MEDQALFGQVQGNQSFTVAVMMVAPQKNIQTECTKKTHIFLGSFEIFLGMIAIIFNVNI